ncbi:MAG: hypothetical protein IKJ92_00380 [Bacteroidaceae bacterium]|nr:hypothetical protein [Bacteroidaceae bacterium]
MKRPFYILALLGCIISFAACTGPVIIDEEEEDNTEQGDDTLQRDSVPIIHEGTRTSPYSIAEAQTLRRGRGVWIEGYIVGCVKGSMKSGCNYTSEATTTANILLADTFPTGNEEDYLYCLPVELPNGDIRMELNLYDNPENYHRKVRIAGDLTLYYSVVGLKEIADCTWDTDDENDNEDDNDDEEMTDSIPYNSQEYPLSIADGIKLQDEYNYNQAWIRGYIVGYAKGKNSVAYLNSSEDEITSKAQYNVVLADSIGENDNQRIIIVELPKGFIRDDVNLYDNPQNLHKRLTVIGRMIPYYGLAGCRETLGTENRERFCLE